MPKLFANYSNGVKTQRDVWCFNSSKTAVSSNMASMIKFYGAEVERFSLAHVTLQKNELDEKVDDFIDSDATRISWTRALKQDLVKGRSFEFDAGCIVQSVYRPFTKQWLYFNRRFNEMVYQMPKIFPGASTSNLIICIAGPGCISGFTALISEIPVELCISAMKGGSQCFPLHLYERNIATDAADLFASSETLTAHTRRDAITDKGLAHFQSAYPNETISKEDLFYYVYGLLHSEDYRERYADNLSKELPRISRVKSAADFRHFSQAGRDLADLHLHYETVAMYPGATVDTGGKTLTDADYRVEKMKYGKQGKIKDLTTLHYNARITVTGIPLEAYDYVVNGKPALDWVVERQCVKTDKDSGIVNDANDWAIDTMGNPRYPLELFLRVITVSLDTMKIVRALPTLDIRDDG